MSISFIAVHAELNSHSQVHKLNIRVFLPCLNNFKKVRAKNALPEQLGISIPARHWASRGCWHASTGWGVETENSNEVARVI